VRGQAASLFSTASHWNQWHSYTFETEPARFNWTALAQGSTQLDPVCLPGIYLHFVPPAFLCLMFLNVDCFL
jgi:hypothetical protein